MNTDFRSFVSESSCDYVFEIMKYFSGLAPNAAGAFHVRNNLYHYLDMTRLKPACLLEIT